MSTRWWVTGGARVTLLAACLGFGLAGPLARAEEAGGPPAVMADDALRAAEIQIDILKNAVADALAARARSQAELELLRRDRTAEIDAVRSDRAAGEARIGQLADELAEAKAEIARLTLDVAKLTDGAVSAGPVRSVAFAPAGADGANGTETGLPESFLSEPSTLRPDEFQVGEIHFNPGSAELTPGGRRKTLEAARRIKSMEVSNVRVVGYTDSAGGAEFNKHLSLLRADAIADLMASVGLAREVIEVDGSGEDGAPEQTADDVSEPLNRCAGIYVVAESPK